MSNQPLNHPGTPATGVWPVRQRWHWVVLVAAVIGLAVGLGIWLWPRPPLEPPAPDMAEVDPEVGQAITVAQNKVRQQPSNGAAWGRLGMVFLAHDFHDEARQSFAQAERLDPADARWPYLRGLSLTPIDPDAALACLERAARLCGKAPLTPRLSLAERLLDRNRIGEAEFHFEQARKVEPNNVRVQLGLGRIAMLRGQWRAALEHLEPCTEEAYTRRLAHSLRAEAWTRLGETDKAGAEQQQAEQETENLLWPDPFVEEVLGYQCGLSVHLQRANDLSKQRRYQQAVELLQETARRYPQSAPVWLLLGDVWRQRGRMDRSEQAYAEAVRIDPESVVAWYKLGCSQQTRGRPRAAADSFRRAIRLKADHTDAHLNLGNCLKEMGDAAGAADAFRAALRCRPDDERARQALRAMDKKK